MKIDHPVSADIPRLRLLWKEAFGDDDSFLDAFFTTAFSPDRCRCIWENAQPAAALYWFDCEYAYGKIAYIYAVATHPDFRGQGLCRRLMADTHRLLQENDYAGAVLVPGENGLFAMYEKMGYRPFSGMDCFVSAAGQALPLQALTAQDYAERRRQLLPAGGVVQEQENLAFFSCFARFYKGENCLLAVAEESGNLRVVELLGDPSAAPGILAQLHYDTGTFRVPGSAPFAMFHPFRDTPAPGYFGLAFD